MSKNKVPDGPLVPRTLPHQIDKKVGSWKTTYDIINEAPFRLEPLSKLLFFLIHSLSLFILYFYFFFFSLSEKRVYGVSSIRNVLVAPDFRKIQDKTNYGNDGNAWSLLSPSIFAQRGVYERDVMKRRPKHELMIIFNNIGANLSPDEFESVWSRASEKNGNQDVSVEEFRCALDEIEQMKHEIDAQCNQREQIVCLGGN